MPDRFEEYEALERNRRERAKEEPIIDVTGIIPSTGVALVEVRGRPTEEVVIFDIWRIGNGPLESQKLRLVQEVIRGKMPLGSLRAISPTSVIETKARILRSEDEVFGVVTGQFHVVTPDVVMAESLERLQQPETFYDAQLGQLVADPLLGWVGQAKWLGKDCSFSIEGRDELTTAHALWGDQRRWTTDAVQCAINKLIDLKNNSWLDQAQSPVTAKDFQRKMTLTSISIGKEGAFVLDFDDGDLFGGHTIVVEGDVKVGPIGAYIAG